MLNCSLLAIIIIFILSVGIFILLFKYEIDIVTRITVGRDIKCVTVIGQTISTLAHFIIT